MSPRFRTDQVGILGARILPIRMSGSALKCLAMTAMAIDHCAIAFVDEEPLMLVLRTFGRIAFPVFAFMAVQGLRFTRNRTRYIAGLWLCGILSEPVWRLMAGGACGTSNVLFTLATGVSFLALFPYGITRGGKIYALSDFLRMAAASTGVSALITALNPDYGVAGFALIVGFWLMRDWPRLSIICLFPLVACIQGCVGAALAVAVLITYDGTRGFIRTTPQKYLLYIFYPAHLAVIWALMRRIIPLFPL